MPRRPLDMRPASQRAGSDAATPGRVIDVTAPGDDDAMVDVTDAPPPDDTPDDGFVPL